jgi:hypothetical protein
VRTQVGGILGGELVHDARAVHFDGARRNAEIAPGFPIGSAARDLLQHFALTRGQPLVAGKYPRQRAAFVVVLLPGVDGVADARCDFGGIERLFDEILCAAAHGVDCGRYVVAAGHDQNRCWITRRVEPLQHVEARATWQVGIDHDAVRRARARGAQEGFAFDEIDDVETFAVQSHRQRGVDQRIVVDDKDFAHQRAIGLDVPEAKRFAC